MKDDILKRAMLAVLEELGLDPKTPYKVERYLANLWISCIQHITVEKPGENNNVDLFVKTLPDQKRADFFGSFSCFRNEVFVYTKIFAGFSDLQRERGVEEPLQLAPRCYYADCDGKNDIVVLEDLSDYGFRVPSSKQPLDLRDLRLLMQTLGKFHALSLAMKTLQPERFRDISAAMQEVMWVPALTEGEACDYFNMAGTRMFNLLVQEEGSDSRYALKLRDFSTKLSRSMMQVTKPDPDNEPFNVITHGDMWISNLLYRHSAGHSELRLIDFQHSRYGSPALDLSSVLFLCMDGPGRAQHGDELLRVYHQSMSQFLEYLRVDPDQILPFCQIEEQLKKFGRFGVGTSLLNVPHAVRDDPPKKLVDLEDIKADMWREHDHLSEEARRRILDNFRDCVDRGYVA